MKPEQDDRLEPGGDLSTPGEAPVERLQPPEIVGQVDNPVLETVRRLWWRAFDRVCGFFVLLRLWIFDRIHGPEPPTSADLTREADHERLVRDFPAAGEAIEPTKMPCRAKSSSENRISMVIAAIRNHPSRVRLDPEKHPPAFPYNLVPSGRQKTEDLCWDF
jgi:hypothetical protein